jgi:hypothetical protein
VLAVDKQFAEVTEEEPPSTASFKKLLGPEEIEFCLAAKAVKGRALTLRIAQVVRSPRFVR